VPVACRFRWSVASGEVDVIGGLVDAHTFECWVSESTACVNRWTVGIRTLHYSFSLCRYRAITPATCSCEKHRRSSWL
jgi:hypothetical protein